MSTEAREFLGVMLGLAPWMFFAAALVWSFAHDLRDRLRAEPVSREQPRHREAQRHTRATPAA